MDARHKFQDYVCGGYFLARVARNYRRSAYLPNAIVTVSDCFTDTLPDSWAIDWMNVSQEERREAALRCGLGPGDLESFIVWTTERVNRKEIGISNVIFSKSTADDLLRRFTFDPTDWRLLALGLRGDKTDQFLLSLQPTYQGPGTFGVYDAICRRNAPDPAGDLIGYDVLGMNGYGECHSWFCNSLEEPISAELGIRPGPDGLLATYAEAEACAEYASRPEVGAEPVSWYAWAVIGYTI